MKIRFQFNLKVLFRLTTVVALLLAGFLWWRWWNRTRHMSALSNAVMQSGLSLETKQIISQLAWSQKAWDNGLIGSLLGPTSVKHVVWKGVTSRGQEVYIFDAYIRPVADMPFPPTCVVFDRDGRGLTWERIAPWSQGFLQADLNAYDVLTVKTANNWSSGTGTYHYAIKEDSIVELGEVKFEGYAGEERPEMLPQMPSLGEIWKLVPR
jgi:hypothetical protein